MIYSAPRFPPQAAPGVQAAAGVPLVPPAPALPPGTVWDGWWSLPEHSPEGFTRRLAAFVSVSKYVRKVSRVTSWPTFSIPLLVQCLNLLFHDLGLKRVGRSDAKLLLPQTKKR